MTPVECDHFRIWYKAHHNANLCTLEASKLHFGCIGFTEGTRRRSLCSNFEGGSLGLSLLRCPVCLTVYDLLP
jgi:hypothetical protein